MSTRSLASTVPFFARGVLVFAVAACGDEGASTGTTADGVTTTEASLTGAEDSLGAAADAAKACFEAYRTCEETEGKEAQSCRDDLKTCLPDQAPQPRRCGPRDEGDGDGGVMPPPKGDRPPRPEGDADGDHPRPEPGDAPPDLDADGGPEGGHARHHGKGRGHGHHGCERPPIPGKRMGQCRDVAEEALAAGGDAAAAQAAHDECVEAAFAEHIAKLCTHATDLCANANAPADACDRITTACASNP